MDWLADLFQTVWDNLPLIVQQGIVSSIVTIFILSILWPALKRKITWKLLGATIVWLLIACIFVAMSVLAVVFLPLWFLLRTLLRLVGKGDWFSSLGKSNQRTEDQEAQEKAEPPDD